MYIEKINDKQVRMCCLPNENTLLQDLVQINNLKQLVTFVQFFQEKGFEVIRRKFTYTNQKPTYLLAAANYSEQLAFADYNQSEDYYLKFVK